MKHIVLFKFNNKDCLKQVSNLLSETYKKLKEEYKVIRGYDFFINILPEKEANMDLILFVDLVKTQDLSAYIDHPEHKEFLVKLRSLGLSDKAAIDIE